MLHVALFETKPGGGYYIFPGLNKQEIKLRIEEKFPNQINQFRCVFYRTFIDDGEALSFARRLQGEKEINLKKLIQSENPEFRDLFNLIA